MDISSKTVTFANKIIQTRNISEASSWKNESGKPGWGVYALGIIFLLVGLGVAGSNLMVAAVGVGLGALIIVGCLRWRPTYELQLQTNAGKVTALTSRDEGFIEEILSRIHMAMSEPDSSKSYHVNVDAKTIHEGSVSVSASSGVNVVSGDSSNVQQSNVVGGPSLADISELIEIVRSSGAENRHELQVLLEDVRNFMAGGATSREEARSAWESFVKDVGSMSAVGGSLWDLVGKISRLFAMA